MFAQSLDHNEVAVSTASGETVRQTGGWQNRAGWIGLIVLLVSLGVRYVVLVRSRAMEFDQICTLITAEARSWPAYLAAITIDSQPPFSHIATRIGLALPIPEAVGVHLVSVSCIALTVMCLFRLFQRRGASLAGLCSAALFTSSRCVEFMFTVRPYAALMAVSALGVLVYDTYRLRRASGQSAAVWPVMVVIVLAATVHALSLVYVLAPIILGELWLWIDSRRLDRRLLLAIGFASTAFTFDFVLARRVQAESAISVPLSARTPGLPTLSKLYEVMTFPVERQWQLLLFASVLAVSFLLSRRQRTTVDGAAAAKASRFYPLLAAVAIYLAALLAFVMGAVNHYFFTRYASPVFVSGALLLGAALSTAPWRRFPGVVLALAVVLLCLPLPALRTYLRTGPHAAIGKQNAKLFQHGDIIASPLVFPTLWWYATPQQRSHLRVLTDADHYRNVPDGIPEATLRSFAAAGVLPFPLTPFRDYRFQNEVYFVRPALSGDSWIPAVLEHQGFLCTADNSDKSDAYTSVHCVRKVTR